MTLNLTLSDNDNLTLTDNDNFWSDTDNDNLTLTDNDNVFPALHTGREPSHCIFTERACFQRFPIPQTSMSILTRSKAL